MHNFYSLNRIIPKFLFLNMTISVNLVKLDVSLCQCVHFRRIWVHTSNRGQQCFKMQVIISTIYSLLGIWCKYFGMGGIREVENSRLVKNAVTITQGFGYGVLTLCISNLEQNLAIHSMWLGYRHRCLILSTLLCYFCTILCYCMVYFMQSSLKVETSH